MKTIWRRLTSVRTTVTLLVIVGILLLVSVTLPSEDSLGPAAESFTRSTAGRLLLEAAGLDRLGTSPIFLAVLTLFFLNLTAVLVDRAVITVRRTRLRPPSEATIDRWCDAPNAVTGPPRDGLDSEGVLTVLRGMGFPAVQAGDGLAWGVKHRTAPLGFLAFHLSFYLVLLGGIAIFLTRFVGVSALVEGQSFQGYTQVQRTAPWIEPPELPIRLERVEARFEDGQALHLGADLRFEGAGTSVVKSTRINHPARWGASTILVNRAGVAPILWLQDRDGFTIDRVAVAAETLSGNPTDVALAGGAYQFRITPIAGRGHFPNREELQAVDVRVEALDESGRTLADATLTAGRSLDLGEVVLVIPEIRYWAGLTVVREYGAAALIAGFVLGTLGLIWRLMLYRREIAVVWDGRSVSVAGRAEHFSHHFREELAMVSEMLTR